MLAGPFLVKAVSINLYSYQDRSVNLAVDSIDDIDGFAETLKPALSRDKIYSANLYGGDSYFYGYYDELLRYAGRSRGKITLIPDFEHGIRFTGVMRKYEKYSLSYACQGRNRMHEIHDIDPWKIIFSIGPYIHYARDIYDKAKFNKLKAELGKTLLVMPSHTCEETQNAEVNADITQTVMKKYCNRYDTVLVCTGMT